MTHNFDLETLVIISISLMFLVGLTIGYSWGRRKVLQWRIRWIELEHDSARSEGREPRKITDVYPN